MRGSFDGALEIVAPIVADVRARGDDALLEWTERLDGPRPDGIRVPAERIEAARVEGDVLDALRRMIDAVRRFSEAQRPVDTTVEAAPGIVSERRWLPARSHRARATGHQRCSAILSNASPVTISRWAARSSHRSATAAISTLRVFRSSKRPIPSAVLSKRVRASTH